MAWPKGKSRVRLAPVSEAVEIAGEPASVEPEMDIVQEPVAIMPPAYWGRGALLNVRNTGADYVVTLHPEEYDTRSPERAMRFANPAECQDFVSKWYMRESYDPRAR